MKLNCNVIEDILPLYSDNACSPQTKILVENHLAECEKCRCLVEKIQSFQLPRVEHDKLGADIAVKKGFKKIRFRWWATVLAVIIIIPLVFLSWNQYHGKGVHYTNIFEIQIGKAFMKCLNDGDYERAYEYIDIDGLKQEWSEQWFDDEKLKNIYSDGLSKFCEYGEKLEDNGGIGGYKYLGISHRSSDDDGTAIYQMIFKVNYEGKETLFYIMVSNDGVEHFSSNGIFIDDPLAQLSIWSEYLWQDYEGCYFDPELKEYVYPSEIQDKN